MLEDWALWLVGQGESTLTLVGFAAMLAGVLIAAMTSRVPQTIGRGAYLLGGGLVALGIVAVTCLWLAGNAAMKAGLLWVLLAAAIAGLVGLGYFTAKISIWRARDAFGSPWYGLLAIVPLANLVLVFKGGRDDMLADRPSRAGLPEGAVAGFLGVIAFVASYPLTDIVDQRLAAAAEQAAYDPDLVAPSVRMTILTLGLDEALRQMAAQTQLGSVDEVTRITKVEATDQTLRHHLVLSPWNPPADTLDVPAVHQVLCSDPAWKEILRAGGAVEARYEDAGGTEIAAVRVMASDCPE